MLKLSLAQPTAPFWLDLPQLGCRVQVRPLTLEVTSAIAAHVGRKVAAFAREFVDRVAAGAPTDDLPDMADPDIREGHSRALQATALARFGIVAWEGVCDMRGEQLPVTPENAERFARHAGAAFVDAYQRGLAELLAEGNASGAVPNGGTAPAPTTAAAASQVH